MGRISYNRDLLAAEQGYLRTIYVARLTGVQRNAVFTWPVEFADIANARFYKWDAVLAHMGLPAVQVLGLPLTAKEALERAIVMAKGTKVSSIAITDTCLELSPADPETKCAREVGHNGKHKSLTGVEWGDPANEKRYEKHKAAGGHKGQGTDAHPQVGKPGKPLTKEGSPELAQQLYAVEPDAPSADFTGPPNEHPLSKFLGNPVKKTTEQIEALVVYNHRVPSFATIKKRKWKCNRAPEAALPDWWMGEYVDYEGSMGVRWSKLLVNPAKKQPVPPPSEPPPDPEAVQAAAQYAQDEAAQVVPPAQNAPTTVTTSASTTNGGPPALPVPQASFTLPTGPADPSPALFALGMTAMPAAPAPPPTPPTKADVVAAAKAFPGASSPGSDGTHVVAPPPPPPMKPVLPDIASLPPPPPPPSVQLPQIPLAPAPPPTVSAPVGPPKVGKTLLCKVSTCGHDISFHGPDGCTYGAGTPNACGCKQTPPPWYLEQLKKQGSQPAA